MPYNLKALRVLVADDNKHICQLLADVLAAFGVGRSFCAADGNAAFAICKHERPDIAIVDRKMPRCDGLQFIRMVRNQSDSPNAFLPIIMMSGYTERARVLEARDTGATEFLAKPFTVGAVYARLLAVIEQPRTFVRTRGYFGPDRRRRDFGYDGEERREPGTGAGQFSRASC